MEKDILVIQQPGLMPFMNTVIIETSIIEFFNVTRAYFGISGSSGIPKIKGKNFTFEHIEKGKVKFSYTVPDEYKDHYIPGDGTSPPKQIPLVSNNKIISQDIYRCLAKYAL